VTARWLATLQLHAAKFVHTSDLPDRGPRHYLVHLFNAREEIGRHLRRPTAAVDGPGVLADLLYKLDALESHWTELSAFCAMLPETVVHGDLVPKNLRILGDADSAGLAIFDLETAGLGVQAPDLAQLLQPERSRFGRESKHRDRFSANPCLDTYRSALAGSVMELDTETIAQSAAVGNVFRCLAGLDWTCAQGTPTWYPVDDFRVYSQWLGNAMQTAGWGPSRRRRILQAR
jgi:Ser/Thr protein kinase RdoA (MazF antagonist)